MDTDNHRTRAPRPLTWSRRRWYALTDNGDWMELTLQVGDDLWDAPGVSFIAVDVEDDDEFFEQADVGEGTLVGRVTMIDGTPSYTRGRSSTMARATLEHRGPERLAAPIRHGQASIIRRRSA
jgi:hypothetical protein